MTINKKQGDAISMVDLRNEWADAGGLGQDPTSLSEFYGEDINIPKRGTISLSDFYGATHIFYVSSVTLGINNRRIRSGYNILNACEGLGWNRYSKLNITLTDQFGAYCAQTDRAAVVFSGASTRPITVNNFGIIMGKGGNGGTINTRNGGSGGPAISVSMNSGAGEIFFYNYGSIFGGGGGGGANWGTGSFYGGGGGGAGGGDGAAHDVYSGGSGGGIGAAGSNADGDGGYAGSGGQAGGGGGGHAARKGTDARGGGGGGGRVASLGASGGAAGASGGAGGSARSSGGSGVCGGGGGFSRSGGGGSGTSGGSGSAAIVISQGTFTIAYRGTMS